MSDLSAAGGVFYVSSSGIDSDSCGDSRYPVSDGQQVPSFLAGGRICGAAVMIMMFFAICQAKPSIPADMYRIPGLILTSGVKKSQPSKTVYSIFFLSIRVKWSLAISDR